MRQKLIPIYDPIYAKIAFIAMSIHMKMYGKGSGGIYTNSGKWNVIGSPGKMVLILTLEYQLHFT